jgi:hypothetical protein
MVYDILVVAYGMAAGFTLAGLITTAYHLLRGEPLALRLPEAQPPGAAMLAVLLRMLAAPVLLVRDAMAKAADEEADPLLLAAGLAAACAWSFLSGVVAVELLSGLSPMHDLVAAGR